MPEARWWVYVLTSSGRGRAPRCTYVGITVDPARRVRQHNGVHPGGAARTRAGRPWRLARLHGPFSDRAAAQRAEAFLKRKRGRARLERLAAAEILARGLPKPVLRQAARAAGSGSK